VSHQHGREIARADGSPVNSNTAPLGTNDGFAQGSFETPERRGKIGSHGALLAKPPEESIVEIAFNNSFDGSFTCSRHAKPPVEIGNQAPGNAVVSAQTKGKVVYPEEIFSKASRQDWRIHEDGSCGLSKPK